MYNILISIKLNIEIHLLNLEKLFFHNSRNVRLSYLEKNTYQRYKITCILYIHYNVHYYNLTENIKLCIT